jgi:prepilin-type N-terminal cleavage/methylation domain-containing protein
VNLRDERGFTMVELLVVAVLTVIVLGGAVDIFVSGTRAGTNVNDTLQSQQDVRVALDRLEFEGRCASAAALVSSGAGVDFTLPTQCSHATGNVTWCVSGGLLKRYVSATCGPGASQLFSSGVTSATPFTLVTAVGDLPRLDVRLTVNGGGNNASTLTDVITLRNAAVGS